MQKTLSDTELNQLLYNFTYQAMQHNIFAQMYFEDLYITGCRSTEPLQRDRWLYENGIFYLTTLKTNSPRKFQAQELSIDLILSIENNEMPYSGLTYDQLTALFRKHIAIHPIYAGDRIADTYLFRYNRARQMFKKTNSIAAVKDYFGWNSMEMAHSYITQPLVYKTL